MRIQRSRRWRASIGAGVVALCVAACGGSSSPASSSASKQGSAAISGKQVFENSGCASCHTLAAADASGSVGPDLDTLKPTMVTVERQVTDGGGVMPSFAGTLSKAQIVAVARFVSEATR
jgi:mono/diheme cytochrome c family protein